MKSFTFFGCLMGVGWMLLLGCGTPRMEESEYGEGEGCREKAMRAMRFDARPERARNYLNALAGADEEEVLGQFLAEYYEVLGVNISSVVMRLRGEHAERLSMQVNPRAGVVAERMTERLTEGRSLVDEGDVGSMERDGEFLRVAFSPGGVVSGHFYVICQEIAGRSLAQQTFFDYQQPGEGSRKLSLEALVMLLEE